jgi:hypothetical protein
MLNYTNKIIGWNRPLKNRDHKNCLNFRFKTEYR